MLTQKFLRRLLFWVLSPMLMAVIGTIEEDAYAQTSPIQWTFFCPASNVLANPSQSSTAITELSDAFAVIARKQFKVCPSAEVTRTAGESLANGFDIDALLRTYISSTLGVGYQLSQRVASFPVPNHDLRWINAKFSVEFVDESIARGRRFNPETAFRSSSIVLSGVHFGHHAVPQSKVAILRYKFSWDDQFRYINGAHGARTASYAAQCAPSTQVSEDPRMPSKEIQRAFHTLAKYAFRRCLEAGDYRVGAMDLLGWDSVNSRDSKPLSPNAALGTYAERTFSISLSRVLPVSGNGAEVNTFTFPYLGPVGAVYWFARVPLRDTQNPAYNPSDGFSLNKRPTPIRQGQTAIISPEGIPGSCLVLRIKTPRQDFYSTDCRGASS